MAAEYNGGGTGDREARPGAPDAPGALGPRRPGNAPLVLDGATGTELERRGLACEAPLWSARALAEAPDAILDVHRGYVAAGVDALTADTFRTQARSLARAGVDPEDAAGWTARAVALARRAADEATERRVLVLGSAAPLEDCYAPERVPDDDALAREHGLHAANLCAAGVDAVLVETMNCVREAVAALRAAREAGAAAWVSFVCDERGRLLSGEPLAEALEAVGPLEPALVGVNCLPPRAVPPCLAALRAAGRPFGVHANLGAPLDAHGLRRTDDASPVEFARAARSWADAGAAAVGGCCGTTPAHLQAVVEALRPSAGPTP